MSSRLSFIKEHKTPIRFLNSTLFLYGITLITGLITYRYISPDYLGIWATFSTFTIFATFLRLGIPNGMNRELPFYLGKGEKEKAEEYAATTLYYTIITMLVLAAVGIVFFFSFDFDQYLDYSHAYKLAALVIFINISVEPYMTYLSGTYRTSANFNKLSQIQYNVGWVRLLSIPLVVFYSYNGYLVRELLISIFNLLLLHIARPLPQIKPHFNWEKFKNLFSIGFSIFLVSYIMSVIDTFPRLFIIKYGSTSDLGLFSPILIILSTVYLIPNTISNYLYPRFAYAYGAGRPKVYFWKKMRLLLWGSVAIGLCCAFFVYIFIDKLIIFFPKYIDSVKYIKMSCLGMAFIGYKVANVICVIFKLYSWLWVTPILYFIIQVTSIIILQFFISDPITVSSLSIVVTYCLMFFASFFMVYHVTHNRKERKYEIISENIER